MVKLEWSRWLLRDCRRAISPVEVASNAVAGDEPSAGNDSGGTTDSQPPGPFKPSSESITTLPVITSAAAAAVAAAAVVADKTGADATDQGSCSTRTATVHTEDANQTVSQGPHTAEEPLVQGAGPPGDAAAASDAHLPSSGAGQDSSIDMPPEAPQAQAPRPDYSKTVKELQARVSRAKLLVALLLYLFDGCVAVVFTLSVLGGTPPLAMQILAIVGTSAGLACLLSGLVFVPPTMAAYVKIAASCLLKAQLPPEQRGQVLELCRDNASLRQVVSHAVHMRRARGSSVRARRCIAFVCMSKWGSDVAPGLP